MRKIWQSIKCFFGFHIKGEFSRTTHRLFNIRQKYFCAVCKVEYNESVVGSKPWGG